MTLSPTIVRSPDACVDYIIEQVGKTIIVGLPLGLGKPPQLVNALYRRAKADPSIRLTFLTALSLQVPSPGTGLQNAFLAPVFERVFGDYPGLDYVRDIEQGTVPSNIDVHEFFFKSGSMLGNDYAQQRYISTNYTHAPRDIMAHNVNVVCQLVAHRVREGRDEYSLSCNPEVTLDMLPHIDARRERGERILAIGQVHDELPFMVNDARVDASHFDALLVDPACSTRLFAPPNQPVSTTDYMIGLNASTLVRDGSTLQIGIGSLGDAIVYGCEWRHEDNAGYNAFLEESGVKQRFGDVINAVGGTGGFDLGLNGASEMFVSGFFQLMKAGILRRKVYPHLGLQRVVRRHRWGDGVSPMLVAHLLDAGVIKSRLDADDVDFLVKYGVFRTGTRLENGRIVAPDGTHHDADVGDVVAREALLPNVLGTRLNHGVVMHGGFFVGNQSFYEGLRNLSEEQRAEINMTAISYVNALYGDEMLKRAQREDARFINTVFMVHLLGAATSDGLSSGQVVSGVGGQYNFVAQAHELDGARSILMLKSTRTKNGVTQSNIVFNYGHVTIPRHLRDIYVTEYGIADVRGRADSEVVAALLNIADSRFQPDLLARAKAAGKIARDYEIPEPYRNNYPERLEAVAAKFRARGHLPAFPAGSDFTPAELRIAKALKTMAVRAEHLGDVLGAWWRSRTARPLAGDIAAMVDRMGLGAPATFKDRVARQLLIEELLKQG